MDNKNTILNEEVMFVRCVKIAIVSLSLIFLGFGGAGALETYYTNQGGYNNLTGYNNKIPYSAFFNWHSPKPDVIKVQKTTRSGAVIQAKVPINQPEEKIEQRRLDE